MLASFYRCALALLLTLTFGAAQATQVPSALAVRQGIPHPAVIAHRGASFDAPESTAAAYTLARDLGADYLELDLQRSKDGVLFAFHDDNLQRTTDVARKFPARKNSPANAFTWRELQTLDAGSWFNQAYPERARASYVGLKILSLEHIIDIAQGSAAYRPGLYIETKQPALFPGIEHDLRNTLHKRGLLDQPHSPALVGHGPGKVILQTFDKNSLALLHKQMPDTPKILLLWVGEGGMKPRSTVSLADSGAPDKATYYAAQEPQDSAEFARWIRDAKALGAIGTGPSARRRQGGDQSYMDLIKPWMNQMTHAQNLLVHAYTLDEPPDFEAALNAGVDGIFTNRTDSLLKHLKRSTPNSVAQVLGANGY